MELFINKHYIAPRAVRSLQPPFSCERYPLVRSHVAGKNRVVLLGIYRNTGGTYAPNTL